MEYGLYGEQYVLRLDEGEEAVATIREFLTEHGILAGYFVAWGGFSRLRLEYFSPGQRAFKEWLLDRQVEVASLLGNIACQEGRPVIHAHLTVGDEDFRTYSGHLAEGTVRPMLEVFVVPLPGELRRVRDPVRNLFVLAPVGEPVRTTG